MSLPLRTQAAWWGTGFVVFLVLLWVLQDALLPFFISAAIAYFLDPVADRLERLGCSRFLAVAILFVLFLLIVLPTVSFIAISLASQIADLIEIIPGALAALHECSQNDLSTIASLLSCFTETRGAQSAVSEGRAGFGSSLGDFIANFDLEHLWSLVSNILVEGRPILTDAVKVTLSALSSSISLLIIVPVVMIYLLADWDKIIATIGQWLPRDHADEIAGIFAEIDERLAGFVRGQLVVCGLMAIFYAVSLMLVGLQFGLAIGFIAGFVSFIPVFGAVLGAILAIGLAIFQYWQDPIWIGAVTAVFFAGQILEGNILTPRLVGASIKLHPVWLLFALSAFYALFGFAGALIAVPAAATIGVLFRFMVGRYLGSRLYLGSTAVQEHDARD